MRFVGGFEHLVVSLELSGFELRGFRLWPCSSYLLQASSVQ
jgi:hypothetical protein